MRTSEAAKLSLTAPPGCEELCRTHYARVFQLCRLLLVDRHEAEEVAQEVFLKLVKECQSHSQILSWEAWLTRVAINACRDRRRSAPLPIQVSNSVYLQAALEGGWPCEWQEPFLTPVCEIHPFPLLLGGQ